MCYINANIVFEIFDLIGSNIRLLPVLVTIRLLPVFAMFNKTVTCVGHNKTVTCVGNVQ